MKKSKKIISASFVLFSLLFAGPGAKAQTPVEYMDKITGNINAFSEDLFSYMSSIAHDRSARKTESKRKELIKTCQSGQKNVEKMQAYEGDAALRDSVVSFFQVTYSLLTEDFSKIVDMEAVAEQSYDLMEAYLLAQEKASQRVKEASGMMIREQQNFAGRHNIKLIETQNEKSKKLEKAEKVFKNYNVYFLIFFKPYKQEIYLLDALGKTDINALRQSLDALEAGADEGLKKLDTTKAFANDPTVASACKEMMKFYKEEAAEKGPAMVNFLVQQDNMKKAKETFESIAESKRRQADIDKYNAAIADFNKSLETFNKNNDYLNKKRQQLLDRWNKAGPDFLGRHVPKNK
ncbi:MAG: hypothetical protein FD123_2460 [Bacteroidetes bacterium]|nr:MAG: hypothetical protein FD123_2460 [Bacteroidota bacterium]